MKGKRYGSKFGFYTGWSIVDFFNYKNSTMSKGVFFGQLIFSQMINLLSKAKIDTQAKTIPAKFIGQPKGVYYRQGCFWVLSDNSKTLT